MTDVDLNHYVKRADLQTALIIGGVVRSLCGEPIEPELRIGSSGAADDPDLAICPACDEILYLEDLLWRSSRTPVEVTA